MVMGAALQVLVIAAMFALLCGFRAKVRKSPMALLIEAKNGEIAALRERLALRDAVIDDLRAKLDYRGEPRVRAN